MNSNTALQYVKEHLEMLYRKPILISEFELETLLTNVREDISAKCEQALTVAHDEILGNIDAYFDYEIRERVLDAYQWGTAQSETATADHE
jgi:hypothetical protein